MKCIQIRSVNAKGNNRALNQRLNTTVTTASLGSKTNERSQIVYLRMNTKEYDDSYYIKEQFPRNAL
jgi:hypothetical protein